MMLPHTPACSAAALHLCRVVAGYQGRYGEDVINPTYIFPFCFFVLCLCAFVLFFFPSWD